MEHINEIISAFLNNGHVIALITCVLSFLAANALTIILFGIKCIKIKNAELQNKQNIEESQKKILKEVDERLDKIEKAIVDKIDEQDIERKKKYQEEVKQLQDAVNASKELIDKTVKK